MECIEKPDFSIGDIVILYDIYAKVEEKFTYIGNDYFLSDIDKGVWSFVGDKWKTWNNYRFVRYIPVGKKENEGKKENGGKIVFVSNHLIVKLEKLLESWEGFNTLRCIGDCYVVAGCKSTLNSSEENYIYNSSSGNLWVKDRNQKVKLGKLLSTITNLTPLEIEEVVNKWKSIYEVDTSKVIISYDIGDVYDISSCGGSCMANEGYKMGIYEDLGCKIAYTVDNDGDLLSRALLWDNNIRYTKDNTPIKFMDRIFYENENAKLTLEKWASENGFRTALEYPAETVETVCTYAEVPYVDTMCYVNREFGCYRLSSSNVGSIDVLQATDGSSCNHSGISEHLSEDMVWCDDIGEYEHIDNAFYCNTDDSYYGSDYELVYIDSNGFYREDDSYICYCEDIKGYDFKKDCYLTYDGEWYRFPDELVYCDDIGEYVHIDGDYVYVEDLDEYYYHYSSVYQAPDGTYWSSEEAYNENN